MVDRCLGNIRDVLNEVSNGSALFEQVEAAVKNRNAERARRLIEAMPLRHKHLMKILIALLALLTLAGAAAAFFDLGN